MKRLLIALAMIPSLAIPVGAVSPSTDCVEPWEREVAHLVNDEREARGLNRLYISDTLSASAEHMVQDFSHYGLHGHYLHDGTTASQNRDNHGYTYNTWQGQNIAAGQSSPAAVVFAWMASPGHRDNILNPNYRVIGSGYTKGADGWRYWATDFGGYPDGVANDC